MTEVQPVPTAPLPPHPVIEMSPPAWHLQTSPGQSHARLCVSPALKPDFPKNALMYGEGP